VLRCVLALIVASSASSAFVVNAQDAGVTCDPPEEFGPVEVTPAAGASSVRLNAFVRVQYSRDYFAGASGPTETITLALGGVAVSGRTELAGTDTLYFIPDVPLDPNVRYDGTASGSVFPFEFDFRTGFGTDVANPDLRNPAADDAFKVTSSRVESACSAEGSRRIGLEFTSASDDGPSSSIEYWVYLTRANGLSAPRLLARVRDYGAPVTTIGAILRPTEAESAACVSVVAVDGLERSTEWSSPACFDPQAGTGFAGLCAFGSRRSSSAVAAMVAAGLLLVWRRSRALTGTRRA